MVRDTAIRAKLVELVEQAFAKMTYDENTYGSLRNSISRSQKGGYVFCYNAPVLIIVGYPATADGKPDRNPLPQKGNEVTWL